MAIADEFVLTLKAENSQLMDALRKAQAALQEVQKSLEGTSEKEKKLAEAEANLKKATLEATKDTRMASDAFKKMSGGISSIRSSFLSLRTVLMGFLIGSGISRLTDSLMKVSNLSKITGQSVGSIRALANTYEELGYSASDAYGTIESLSTGIAKASYTGGMEGMLAHIAAFGVDLKDKNGNPRETGEMLVEFGQNLLRTSKDMAEAKMKMKAMGFNNADISFIDAAISSGDPKKFLEQKKAEAKVFEQQAENAEKLNRTIKKFERSMMDLGVQALPIVEPVLNEITDGLQKLVSLAGENPKEAAIAIKAIGAAAVAATGPVGMIVAGLYALKELYEKFQEWLSTGNDIQKSAISGEHEAVDALAYDIKTGGEKKGDVFTPFYQSARETLGEIFGTGERGRGATPLPVLMRTAEMRRKIFARKLSRI